MIAATLSHHEGAGRDEQVEFRVGAEEEHEQRPELGRELEQRMRRGSCPFSSFQFRRKPGEIARGERREIVDAFADADEMHRQFVTFPRALPGAPPPRAVPSSLVITAAGDAGRTVKRLDLRQRVWPTVASSTSSTACGASVIHLPDELARLFQVRSSARPCSAGGRRCAIRSTSKACSVAAVSALKARLAESEPCAPR